jgi:hypothetical protein
MVEALLTGVGCNQLWREVMKMRKTRTKMKKGWGFESRVGESTVVVEGWVLAVLGE